MKLTDYHLDKLQDLAIRLSQTVSAGKSSPTDLLPMVLEAMPVIREIRMLSERQRRDEKIAQIAARLLPWEDCGDEAAAQRAVDAARQLMNAAESFGKEVPS